MDNFQIQTAQNVSIQQQVAGVEMRILAYLIDGLIKVGYVFLAGLLFFAIFDSLGGANSSETEIVTVLVIILLIPVLFYSLAFEIWMNGKTPGKHALSIRVAKLDGSRPGIGSYFIRWVMRLIDFSLLSGAVALVVILVNGKGQRVGDIAAGTTVINEKPKFKTARNLLVQLPENYEPKYPQVMVLSDPEFRKVKDLFKRAKKGGQYKVIIGLHEKLKAVMDIEPDEVPLKFIERVIKDYTYYAQNT